MQLHAKRVSAIVSGDYYQAIFDSEDRDDEQVDPFDQPAPYVLVQREFEDFNGGKCYIESHDEEYIGHFKLKLLEFSPRRLAYEIARRDHKIVEVSLALTVAEFEEAQPIIEVIFGVREPGDDDHIADDTL
jgi:hypothetical protein